MSRLSHSDSPPFFQVATTPLWVALLVLAASCAAEDVMHTPVDPAEFSGQPLHCSTAAMMGESVAMMAWRVDVTPGGRCHQVTLRYDVATHHEDGSGWSVDPIEETEIAVGPVDAELVALEFGVGRLELTGIAGHAGLWTGTLTRAGETHPVSCFSDIWQPRFRYDGDSGQCLDSVGDGGGQAGRNPIPVPVVRDSGVGECADLRGQMLNEDDLSYPEWRGFDLRGADLGTAQLSFANIQDAQLAGAQLADLEFGYAVVSGTTDSFTSIPDSGACTHENGFLDCLR